MGKDDLYFIVGTALSLLALLGVDWKLVWGNIETVKRGRGRAAFLLIAVIGSLAMSSLGWYESHHKPDKLVVTLSAYQPVYPSPMQVVKDQTFQDQDVPLDGFDYDHVTFKNVCFNYLGGSYELQSVTLLDNWKICTSDPRMRNF